MLSKCANYIPMLILILMATLALAQSDPEKFAEGRVALDTHKDCPAAYRALSGVSENGRKDAMWIYYMGKTTECLKKYEDALSYYRAYSKLIPPNAELLKQNRGNSAVRSAQGSRGTEERRRFSRTEIRSSGARSQTGR